MKADLAISSLLKSLRILKTWIRFIGGYSFTSRRKEAPVCRYCVNEVLTKKQPVLQE